MATPRYNDALSVMDTVLIIGGISVYTVNLAFASIDINREDFFYYSSFYKNINSTITVEVNQMTSKTSIFVCDLVYAVLSILSALIFTMRIPFHYNMTCSDCMGYGFGRFFYTGNHRHSVLPQTEKDTESQKNPFKKASRFFKRSARNFKHMADKIRELDKRIFTSHDDNECDSFVHWSLDIIVGLRNSFLSVTVATLIGIGDEFFVFSIFTGTFVFIVFSRYMIYREAEQTHASCVSLTVYIFIASLYCAQIGAILLYIGKEAIGTSDIGYITACLTFSYFGLGLIILPCYQLLRLVISDKQYRDDEPAFMDHVVVDRFHELFNMPIAILVLISIHNF